MVELRRIFCRLRAHPGDEDPFLAVFQHGLDDACDLFRGLSCTIDHFGSTLTDFPMEVNLGIADVLKGSFLDFQQRVIHGCLAGFHRL